MSIDFHRLMEPIDINRLIFIDYIDYIDWFPMIDFHRLDKSGNTARCSCRKHGLDCSPACGECRELWRGCEL